MAIVTDPNISFIIRAKSTGLLYSLGLGYFAFYGLMRDPYECLENFSCGFWSIDNLNSGVFDVKNSPTTSAREQHMGQVSELPFTPSEVAVPPDAPYLDPKMILQDGLVYRAGN